MRYYFELRKDKINQNGLIPLRLVIANGRYKIRKNLGIKTMLNDWNNDLQIITNFKQNPFYQDYENYNEIINKEKKKLDKISAFFKYNEIAFTETLFNEKYNDDRDIKVTIGFFDAYDEYIKVSKLTKTKGTITKYGTVKNFLIAFEKYMKFELRLDNIDFQFEEAFMDYCFNTRQTLK
ncbi:Arm DNA-binding domain-containing protein [Epilithonimonas sp.]|uniref:Arm DNA-binding domain-containing protein n=1 Tax=Epilithonimonas sp. TaxID=2894511 RepID=UPI002FDEB9AB